MSELIEAVLVEQLIFGIPAVPLVAFMLLSIPLKRKLQGAPAWAGGLPLALADLAVPVAVALTWTGAYLLLHPPKSLANLEEFFWLGAVYGGLLLVRWIFWAAKPKTRRPAAMASLLGMVVLAALFCLFFPCLPE